MPSKIWTPADIRTEPQPHEIGVAPYFPVPTYADIVNPSTRSRFTPEFLAAYDAEQAWQLLNPLAPLDPALHKSIGVDEILCPACGGSGSVQRRYIGSDSGIRFTSEPRCQCQGLRAFWAIWTNTPREWQHVTLDTLEPDAKKSPMHIDRQKAVIAAIKSSPDSSALFFGPAGTGKTLFSYGLFRRALEEWAFAPTYRDQSVWWFSTTGLLRMAAEHACDLKKPAVPINRAIIHARARAAAAAGAKVHLFLSEIDKAGLGGNDTRCNLILDLIDAVKEEGGQVVCSSNDDIQVLADKLGGTHAEAIIRRFAAPPFGEAYLFSSSAPKN
jgi:hypothetical protein